MKLILYSKYYEYSLKFLILVSKTWTLFSFSFVFKHRFLPVSTLQQFQMQKQFIFF